MSYKKTSETIHIQKYAYVFKRKYKTIYGVIYKGRPRFYLLKTKEKKKIQSTLSHPQTF